MGWHNASLMWNRSWEKKVKQQKLQEWGIARKEYKSHHFASGADFQVNIKYDWSASSKLIIVIMGIKRVVRGRSLYV